MGQGRCRRSTPCLKPRHAVVCHIAGRRPYMGRIRHSVDTPRQLTRPRRRHIALWLAVAVVAAAAWWAAASAGVYPQCLWHRLTGWLCPGCGLQRAFHAASHGRWLEAWHCNQALLPLAAVMLAALAAQLWPRRLGGLARVLESAPFLLALLVLLVAWSVARNLFPALQPPPGCGL